MYSDGDFRLWASSALRIEGDAATTEDIAFNAKSRDNAGGLDDVDDSGDDDDGDGDDDSVLNSLRVRVYAHYARGQMCAYIYQICQA